MLDNPNWKPADIKIEEWRTVLHNAANLLEKAGWIQESLYEANKGYCLVGAIQQTIFGEVLDTLSTGTFAADDVYIVALDKMKKHLHYQNSVWEWNDDDGRTKEDVINNLREAADAE